MTSGALDTESASPADLPSSLVLAGAGKMGGALLEAWLGLGLGSDRLFVIDPHPTETLVKTLSQRGIALNSPREAHLAPEVLVLAVKPQALSEAAAALAVYAGAETLLVSVVAGKTIADLRGAFPRVSAVVRAMPNTPAAIRRGITGVAANQEVSRRQRSVVQALLQAVGTVEWLPAESQIDAVTALSGSGPAYVFYLTECMAKAGEAAGLEPAQAMRFARATVQGAGALMAESAAVPPATLRQNVTSPGGTTAAALAVLARDPGLASLMTEAVAAAKRRAGELAG